MNKVFMIGNLTRDPELSETKSGVSVCKFSIAVNRNFTNADGERECDFFDVVAWRNLGEVCAQYLAKGKKVNVYGSMQTRFYETDRGEKRKIYEIIAEDVEFLSPREEEGRDRGDGRGYPDDRRREPRQEPPRQRPMEVFDDDGDIPF